MRMKVERVVAVDWSGARAESGQRKHIWVADVWLEGGKGALTLESGRTREEVAKWLAREAEKTPGMVVGLDFLFSYPAWFVREKCGSGTVEEFWERVAAEGEGWLRGGNQWLWGRPGVKRPVELRAELGFRRTDVAGIEGIVKNRPKSPLQIGGAGAVGTGSLRGIPVLRDLRRAGFCVWPFEAGELPVVVEIYPRVFTGDVTKSDERARRRELEKLRQGAYGAWLTQEVMGAATGSEDAFDALLAGLGMWEHRAEFAGLRRAEDAVERLEGRIWVPVRRRPLC
ncbi:MAG: hypothetical protein ACP5M4_09600 [Acidobacteriaceae bacterium]